MFGTVLFGRMQGGEGADRVMGLFINTLPVRVEVGEEGVEASVRRDARAAGASCCGTSTRRWRWRSGAAGWRRRAPLFTALLNYRHSGASAADAGRAERRWRGRRGAARARSARTTR